jgi:CheY-like chemotaxis protein
MDGSAELRDLLTRKSGVTCATRPSQSPSQRIPREDAELASAAGDDDRKGPAAPGDSASSRRPKSGTTMPPRKLSTSSYSILPEDEARDPRAEPDEAAPKSRSERPPPSTAKPSGRPSIPIPREEVTDKRSEPPNDRPRPSRRPSISIPREDGEARRQPSSDRVPGTERVTLRAPTPKIAELPLEEANDAPEIEVGEAELDDPPADELLPLSTDKPSFTPPSARNLTPPPSRNFTPSTGLRKESGVFASAPPGPPSSPGTGQPISSRAAREPEHGVLLLSDNAETVATLSRVISACKASVWTAKAPGEAYFVLEAMGMTAPPRAELVIIDVLMTGLDVPELLKQLKKSPHAIGVRFLVLSPLSAKSALETADVWGVQGAIVLSRGLLQAEADIKQWLGIAPTEPAR